MLEKSFSKKVIALISAAAMAVTATATGLSTLTETTDTASAANVGSTGEEIGEGTFNDGVALPWHICENATGSMQFDITDGIYAIYIACPGGTNYSGESRWDCQFRHRNLTIEQGHTYRITYSVNPSESGHMYAKLGDMNEDDKEHWHSNGDELKMTYDPSYDMDDLVSALKSASKTGTTYDYGSAWDRWYDMEIPADTWSTYAYEFTVSQTTTSNGTGEWCFHFGGKGDYSKIECFPAGTIIRFDNLALVDMTDSKTDYVVAADYEVTDVEVNQVGYYPNASKKATLILGESADNTAYDWELKNAKGTTVASGTTDGKSSKDAASWLYEQVIDFTDYNVEGSGYYIECNGHKSLSFDISSTLYDDASTGGGNSLLTNAMNYFYQNRCGMATSTNYITSDQVVSGSSKTLARGSCHTTDTAIVQNSWTYIYTEEPTGSETVTASKGWHDAGDYGKYVLNGGVSVWTLLNMYERSLRVTRDAQTDSSLSYNADEAAKWDDGSGTVVIPETGNSTPDILDEVKYELDFFMDMQRSDGMVYHKLHDYKWTGLAVAPDESDQPVRIVKPVTLCATLNMAAACAQASRLFEDYDSSYASELLTAAKNAYSAAVKNYEPFTSFDYEGGGVYAPIEKADKGGGAYGDNNASDEYYWAACELYITTGDKSYYTDLMNYGSNKYGTDNGKALEISTTLTGGENNGTYSLFTWGTLNSCGSISLYENSDLMLTDGLLTTAEVQTLKDQVIKAGDFYLALEAESNYSSPYKGHEFEASSWKYTSTGDATGTGTLTTTTYDYGYEWGSNSMVINNSMAMALAYDETHEVKYIDGVTEATDYLFGRNPMEQSYVTGYGEHSTQYVHHRWWSGLLDSTSFPYCPAGVLSGGPNSSMQDPYIQGKGYKVGSLAPMCCYLDHIEAWSTNECTINWNSPLAWVASFLEDEGPNIVRDTDSTTTTTTTSAATTTTTSATTASGSTGDVLLGDVDLNGVVNMSDIVVLNKAISGSVQLVAQATLNADCEQTAGEGITDTSDAKALLQFLVHVVSSLPL